LYGLNLSCNGYFIFQLGFVLSFDAVCMGLPVTVIIYKKLTNKYTKIKFTIRVGQYTEFSAILRYHFDDFKLE